MVLEELGEINLSDAEKYQMVKKINKNIVKSKDRNVMECCV
jgi:hypothetical protein